MWQKLIAFCFFLGSSVTFCQNTNVLIPKPVSVAYTTGSFKLPETLLIVSPIDINNETIVFQDFLKTHTTTQVLLTSNSKSPVNTIQIAFDTAMQPEAYQVNITPETIFVSAKNNRGIQHAFQSLTQLLYTYKNIFPCIEIYDEPKYKWRGMHLDVSRHFFTKNEVKKYIDYLAAYKFNTFHWHLTDDQGWRIEIKKYPKLIEIGAWRNGSMIGNYNEHKFDTIKYGGFYTQEDIKEVVAYATAKHITIVPEIEMPGHAQAALAAYPQYSCTGGPFEVAKEWGVLEDVFCPKEETFTFLEDVLTEVITLFPGEYIHVGGDECPKTRWKNCPHCQKRIKDLNLKDEHELQSYFVQRIEKFINSKGKKIIGWDEILEGGLAPNAAVMSWRGTEGGIAAAAQNHYVVMTPGSHCYFDHYQGNPKNEPLAIGGYTPLEKVYEFNPLPKELNTEKQKYILGAQANVWTEYIDTFSKVQYMVFPRIIALSEVLWGTAEPQNYTAFFNRVTQHFPFLEEQKINYSKAAFEVTSQVVSRPAGKGVWCILKSNLNPNNIRYTCNGSNTQANSKIFSQIIDVKKSKTIKAAFFENGVQQSSVYQQEFTIHKAVSCGISLQNDPHKSYSKDGAFTLVNGIKGDTSRFGSDWLGFYGNDLVATIDLGKKKKLKTISISTLQNLSSWIYFPKEVSFRVSNNASEYELVKTFSAEEIKAMNGNLIWNGKTKKSQFVKVTAINFGKIPNTMPGAGNDSWLFADEIIVK